MKQTSAAILFILSYLLTAGQNTSTVGLLQTNSKSTFIYVDFRSAPAQVYEIGRYIDKAGTGNSIRNIDTLIQQLDKSFTGKNTKVIEENGKLYLVKEAKKKNKYLIARVKNIEIANSNLNNAWYLNSYFAMSKELNERYTLGHHSFRNGFYSWNELNNKEADFSTFRKFTIKRLQKIKDSISNLQNNYLSSTNDIIQNVSTAAYETLKTTLINLRPSLSSSNGYFAAIIKEVAGQKPAYFFQLAGDLPEDRGLIFSTVEKDQELIKSLEAVEGHEEFKKEFFRERRFGKTMLVRIVATYAIIGGLLPG